MSSESDGSEMEVVEGYSRLDTGKGRSEKIKKEKEISAHRKK